MTLDEELREALRKMEARMGVDDSLLVVHEDAHGEWFDADDEPVDPDDVDAEQVIVIRRHLVMPREQAEREGREILGPAEDAVADGIVVVGPGGDS